MIAAVSFVTAFVAMEGVSYALHRWVMHGAGMVWHASHHAPPAGRIERNDLFPLAFAVVGVTAFALAAGGVVPGWVWWAAAGVTAYGAAYLVVHELFIHRRLRVPVPDLAYLRWVRSAHAAHHLDGGEPFGMLLPVVSRERRARTAIDDVLVRRGAR